MEELGAKIVDALIASGPYGLVILVLLVICFFQQHLISRQTKQLMTMAGATGSSLSSTASAMTTLALQVQNLGTAVQQIEMRGARVEATITPMIAADPHL